MTVIEEVFIDLYFWLEKATWKLLIDDVAVVTPESWWM